MKFGAIHLDHAEGAILAHSVKLDRLALKKGRRLSGDDLAALRAAGARTVIARESILAPPFNPASRPSDASKPMNFTLPAHPLSCNTRITANADDSLGAKRPSMPRLPSAAL